MKHVLLLSLLCMLLSSLVQSQEIEHSAWLASFNTFKINKHFSVPLDVQVRSTHQARHVRQVLVRPGLSYNITNKFSVAAGYAYVHTRRTVGNLTGYLAEHRTWQQLLYTHPLGRAAFTHRLRFEERLLPVVKIVGNEIVSNQYATAYRLRYFARSIVPVAAKNQFSKGVYLALQNEVFLNTGNKAAVNGKTFDQNRLYAALGFRFPQKIDIESGYMNQYISNTAGFVNNHILQLAVYKRL